LLAAWIAYWVVLIGVALGPAIAAIWRATHAGTGQGDVTLDFGNGAFSLIVKLAGKTIYSGAASLLSIALLVAGPPLVLWLLWVMRRPQPEAAIPEHQ
jgi:hypothetical protein